MKHMLRARSVRATRGRAIALLAGVSAMLLTTAVIGSTPAGAAAQTRNFAITGSTTIGGMAQDFPPNSLVSLQIDDTTGDITGGTFSIPTYDVTSSGTTAHVTIGQTGPPTGNLDPDTGVMTLLVHTQTTLTIDSLQQVCTFGPFDINLSTDNNGGAEFTGDPLTGTLTAQNISIPAITSTPQCSLAAAISGLLGLPTTTASQIMTLAATDQAVTTTVPITLPPTTSTTAAPAVAAEPAFTG